MNPLSSDPSFGESRQRRATDTRVRLAQVREHVVTDREMTVQLREEAAALREDMLNAAYGQAFAMRADVCEANQNLILASLDALEKKEQALITKAHQEEFLVMLANELRNPMAPILSAAKILSKANLPAEMVSMLTEVINRQVGHLSRLLDDLSNASKIASGKLNIERGIIDISTPLDEAIEQCSSLLEEKGHDFRLSLPRERIHVDADPVRLTQIFANLLNNAAKYTEAGGRIELAIGLVGRAVVIEVSDSGRGISREALPHIFDFSRQEERTLSRDQGRLGLGLTVVQKIVQLHGGTIKAESDGPGTGSRFTVVLPLAEAAGFCGQAEPPPELQPLRFMLVDDNLDAATTLGILLESSGHAVVAAPDGPSALDLFNRQRPDVVICNIGLPGMTGYQLARQMRESSHGEKVVLIGLTGYGGSARAEIATASGFDAQLVKPVHVDDVLRQVAAAGSR